MLVSMWKLREMLEASSSRGIPTEDQSKKLEPKSQAKVMPDVPGHLKAQGAPATPPTTRPVHPPGGLPIFLRGLSTFLGHTPPPYLLKSADNHYPLEVSEKKMTLFLKALEKSRGKFHSEEPGEDGIPGFAKNKMPMESFMLYGKEMGRQLMNSSQEATVEEVADELVTRWKNMSKWERDPWEKRFIQKENGEYKGHRIPPPPEPVNIPTPPSAFMIFAREHRHQYEGCGLPDVLVKRELEERFATMSIEQKMPFYEEQERQAKLNLHGYPGYPIEEVYCIEEEEVEEAEHLIHLKERQQQILKDILEMKIGTVIEKTEADVEVSESEDESEDESDEDCPKLVDSDLSHHSAEDH